jgi:hypothetical protein
MQSHYKLIRSIQAVVGPPNKKIERQHSLSLIDDLSAISNNLSVISNISMLDHIAITQPFAQKIPPSLAKRSIESLVKR